MLELSFVFRVLSAYYEYLFSNVMFSQGRPLAADPKAGVTMSGGNLVLRGVGRTAAGSYACAVSNVEGDARSAPVTLQVMCEYVLFISEEQEVKCGIP